MKCVTEPKIAIKGKGKSSEPPERSFSLLLFRRAFFWFSPLKDLAEYIENIQTVQSRIVSVFQSVSLS